MQRRTWAEIDLDALAHNFDEVRRLVGDGVDILPAVKADAYGHGAVTCARVFAARGAALMGVATLDEAIELRDAGVATPSLILSALLPEDADALIDCGAAVQVSVLAVARAFSQTAAARGARIPVHLKIDTGMGRQGVAESGAVAAACELAALPGLRLDGVMTHFPSADETADTFTADQIDRFADLLDAIAACGVHTRWVHCANSGAVLAHARAHFNLVRPGLMLYCERPRDDAARYASLRQVMTLKSRLILIKDVPVGQTIGYGRTFIAPTPMRVGIVAVGYADGLSRQLSNRGRMLVRGRRCPIIGRVSMDQSVLDLVAAPDAALGDEVVVYGRQGGDFIAIEDVAALAGTIANDIVCAVSRRVPRVCVNGREDSTLIDADYDNGKDQTVE